MTDAQGLIVSEPAAPGTLPVLPAPRCPLRVRAATAGDLDFIDALQKAHTHMVGFLRRTALAEKVAGGHVLIAEDERKSPLGYCIAHDEYMGRDDVGIIVQLNVIQLRQRHLIGATLIKAVFERAAYGCRLFSCWCAQDIHANLFWEAIGFLPLAFRTGSRSKQRTHIYWQRRIREGDTTTPYWFPAKTKAGAVGEDRIVLPIPPGTHWRDVMPVVLPKIEASETNAPRALPGPRRPEPKVSNSFKIAIMRSQSKNLKGLPPGKAAVVTASGIRYVERGDYHPEPAPPKPKRAPKPRAKNAPKQVAAARELRDKYLEQINAACVVGRGKYDVSRALATSDQSAFPALPAPVAA